MGYYDREIARIRGVGPNQSAASARPQQQGGYGGLAGAGFWLQVGGALTETVGSYYAAKNRQYELKSQALSFEFEKTMAAINAKQAEEAAKSIKDAAAAQASMVGLQYAQERASSRASQGARGVAIGVGSAAEESASITYAEQSDKLTINANAIRSANQARLQAQDIRNRGTFAGLSAENSRQSARSIDPLDAAHSTLLGRAGNVAQQGAYNRRYR